MKGARVVPTDQVELSWYGSTDASGHAITYYIYRHTMPIEAANVGSLTEIATTTVAFATIPASAAETTQSFVWWYGVRARDSEGVWSVMANNYYAYAPNPHAMYWRGTSFICYNCHNIPHTSPDSSGMCYVCHGRADENPTASYGDRSTMHVQGDFYDYAGQTAGSKHRNAYMEAGNGNGICSACHYAHMSPYRYTSTTEVSLTASFKRLLAVQTDAGGVTAYSRLSGSRKNDFCFSCHGSGPTWPIAYAGGTSAFGASGGDHNQSGYDTDTAHGSMVVLSNDHPAQNPAIQCLACHNKHASAASSLVDYRTSKTTSMTAYAGAGICFACHSASSGESQVATGYSAPFSWNDRDVAAEFRRSSYHPYSTTDTAKGSLRCTNCHNTHFVKRTSAGSVDPAVTGSAWDLARASSPTDTTQGVTDVTAFCLDCHDGSTPDATRTATVVVPFSPQMRAMSAAPYFPGWNKAAAGLAFTSSGHYSTSGQKALCSNCHDPHASDFPRLTAWTAPSGTDPDPDWTPNAGSRANTSTALSREQNLCYQCHGNGTTGKLATGAKNVATKAELTYAHDPADDTGVHSDEETGGALVVANANASRHAECSDCHDPHAARTTNGSAVHTTRESTVGAAVYGAWGADPAYGENEDAKNWAVTGSGSLAATRLAQSETSFEAFLCFKCHNTGSTIGTKTYTDSVQEFNPSNFSEHNVLGQSIGMDSSFTLKDSAGTTVTIPWTLPAASAFLTTGWTTDSKMTCTDCHDGFKDLGTPDPTTLARGPHGSSVEWILDPDYVNWTNTSTLVAAGNGMSPNNIICAKCHTNLASVNSAHSNHDGRGANGGYCRYCHVRIPHGWKRPRMIAYTTDAAPYAAIGKGLTQVSIEARTPGGWKSSDCNTNGCQHTSSISPYWP